MTETKNSSQAVGLELADLALMIKLLQVVSKRGAIQVDEMAVVGNLYNRLDAFVKAHAPAETTAEDAEPKNAAEETKNG